MNAADAIMDMEIEADFDAEPHSAIAASLIYTGNHLLYASHDVSHHAVVCTCDLIETLAA